MISDGDMGRRLKPIVLQAVLQGTGPDRSGALDATLAFDFPPTAPLVSDFSARLTLEGPWTLDRGPAPLPPQRTVFRLALAVIAEDASGTGAVLTQDEIVQIVQAANDVWRQCCIGFQLPAEITYLPSATVCPGGDGDLFDVEIGADASPTAETDFVLGYAAATNAIEVVFAERIVVVGSVLAEGATFDGGDPTTGIVMGTELTVAGIGVTLAHELGHALGLGHTATPGNLMSTPYSSQNTALIAEQCAVANETLPLPRLYDFNCGQ